MKFGVREICNVVFKAKTDVKIGNKVFRAGQPVLYIDTAKTSTMEGAATTVYATGGRGNTRLIAWEGEKTLTFTVEDALLSPIGFAVLSGAGLFQGAYTKENTVHVHRTTQVYSGASTGVLDLTDALSAEEKICSTAPIFVVAAEKDGSVTGELASDMEVDETGKKLIGNVKASTNYFVDYYVTKKSDMVDELQIDAENFAGYYYVEASTLFRRQDDGKDLPAELTLPNVKIQSNFTFTMASTGDPSTFTFTMDAFPGYTYFEPTRKVLCAIQVIDESISGANGDIKPVFPHTKDEGQITSGGEGDDDSVQAFRLMKGTDDVGYEKTASDLMQDDVKVEWKGVNATITGTFNKIDNWESLPTQEENEKSGHYFALRFSNDIIGKPFEIIKGGKSSRVEKAGTDETFWVLRIDENKTFTFKSDDKIIANLDFTSATLADTVG